MHNIRLTDRQWQLIVERLQQVGDYDLAYNIDCQLTERMIDHEHLQLQLNAMFNLCNATITSGNDKAEIKAKVLPLNRSIRYHRI